MRNMLYQNIETADTTNTTGKIKKNLFTKLENSTPITESLSVDSKTLDDYLKFFTTKDGADMLPYVYLESSQLYDDLVNYKDYYLFNDEACLIKNNTKELSHHLRNVLNVVEIGPGSHHTIRHKTLPILACAPHLKMYHAIDYSENYLQEACNFVKENTCNLSVTLTNADLMQSTPLELSLKLEEKKAVMLLGSTIKNFTSAEQSHILKQIEHLTSSDDIFILSIDTNQDENSLLAAYANQYLYSLISAVLKYYSRINPNFHKHMNLIEPKVKWNKDKKEVEMYFTAKESFSFQSHNNSLINIQKGQEFKGIKSRKSSKQDIINLLSKHHFKTIDVLSNSGNMLMFVCKKR